MRELLERVRVVLCRPSHPGNIGASARAMKTMGISDLRLVAPERFPAPEAQWMAAHAGDVLSNARVHSALGEALALAESAGVDGKAMFETLTTGSADSFALRSHGLKAVLPGIFPERAFSARYALKDLSYALDLARENGLHLPGAETAERYLKAAIDAGDGDAYWPVISKHVEKVKTR